MQPAVVGAGVVNITVKTDQLRRELEIIKTKSTDATSRVKTGFEKVDAAAIKAARSSNKMGREIDDAAKRSGQSLEVNLTNRLKRLEGGLRAVASTAVIGTLVAGLGEFAKRSIEVAARTTEMENKVDVAFKGMANSVRNWSNEASERLGRSRLTLREYASDLGVVVNGLGVTGEEAKKMSTDLSELAVDLGSLFNVEDADAMHAIISGITGETEGLKRFGVVLNQNALDAQLMADGIKGGADEATEAQKALARYEVILHDTAIAHGDATNTAGSYSNQVKALQEDIKDLANDLGEELIPTMATVVTNLRDAIPVIRRVGTEFGDMAAGAIVALRGVSEWTERLTGLINLIPRDIQINIIRNTIDNTTPIGRYIEPLGVALKALNQQDRNRRNAAVQDGDSETGRNRQYDQGHWMGGSVSTSSGTSSNGTGSSAAGRRSSGSISGTGGGSTARRASSGAGSGARSAVSHAAEQNAQAYESLRESLLTDTERATEKWMQAMRNIEQSTATAAEKTDMIARVNNEFFGNKEISLFTPNAIGNSTISGTSDTQRADEIKRLEEMAKDTAKVMADAIANDEAGMKEAFQQTFKDGVRAALDGDFSSFFENWWKDRLASAMSNALDSISSILYDAMKGGSSSGGGGLLSSIASAIFGGARANGGSVQAGKAYLVNENTPNSEFFIPHSNGTILNPQQMGRAAGSNNQGGFNGHVNVYIGNEQLEGRMYKVAANVTGAAVNGLSASQQKAQNYNLNRAAR